MNIYVRLRVAASRASTLQRSMQAVHAVPSSTARVLLFARPCSAVEIRSLARITIRFSARAKAEKRCQGWGCHPYLEGDHALQDLSHGFHQLHVKSGQFRPDVTAAAFK